MMSGELKARIEELEAVAEHVPAGVLGHRLLAALEEYVGGGFEAINIWSQFNDLLEEDARPDDPAEDGHIGRWVQIPVKPEPVEIFDPGIPQRDADLAMPETPDDQVEPEASAEDLEDAPDGGDAGRWETFEPARDPGPIEPAEETKTCKKCGETKPRSGFYAGRAKCKKCFLDENNARRRRTAEPAPKAEGLVGVRGEAGEAAEDVQDLRERRLKGEATLEAEDEKIREFAATRITILPPAAPAPEPERTGRERPKAPERFCANGEGCLSVAQVGRPTKLTHGNKERRCFACQEAGIGEKEGEKMIVRHSAVDQEASA